MELLAGKQGNAEPVRETHVGRERVRVDTLELIVLALVYSLSLKKSMAEIVLTGTLAAGVEQIGLVADHPNGLGKPKLLHGPGKMMRQDARFQFDQPARELDLARGAIVRAD